MEDIVFYIMDAGVFVMFAYMLWRSSTVVIESKIGNKWIIAGMFLLLGAVGFLNYRAPFTWIQLAFMILIAGMYMMLKSGLSNDGIIMAGSFLSFVKAGKITEAQLREIAEYKLPDLNANDVEAAMRIVAGTARNMGIEIEGWN